MKKIYQQLSLREKLSLTQEDFANYLGVTRSLLSLYEKGLRSLPTTAMLKLADLEIEQHQMLQKKGSKPNTSSLYPAVQQHHEKTRKSMHSHAERCKYKKTVLEYKLKKTQAAHAKAESCMELLETILATTLDNKENKYERLWLEIQRRKAAKKIIHHGQATQAKLQAQIQVLEAEEMAYTKWRDHIE